MANGIRTVDPCGFNKGRSSKFRVGSRVRQTPKEVVYLLRAGGRIIGFIPFPRVLELCEMQSVLSRI